MELLIQILGTALTAIATGAIYTATHRGARKTNPAVNDNHYELRINSLNAWVGWVSTFIGLAPFIVLLFAEFEKGLYWSATLVFLIFGPLGIYLVLSYYLHRISYDGNGIRLTSWYGKTTSLAWSEMEDIKYKPNSGYLKIFAREKWFSISTSFVSLRSLLNKMARETNLHIYKLNLPF